MKKLLSLFAFGLILTIGFASQPAKADDVVELYPYDQQACLEGTSECTRTKLYDSHWDFMYNGSNWNIPRGGVQYVSEFVDADNSGFIESTEMTGYEWSSVGGLYINNTDVEVTLAPSSANRSDMTGAWRGLWAYFDADGKLQMFESFINFEFVIYNDGTEEAPDYRLATEAELALYDAAVAAETEIPANTEKALIRLAVDDTDDDGYVIEKISYQKWIKNGVDTATAPEADWSDIVELNPNNVVIPSGWTVLSFGTVERSSSPAIKTWGMSFPTAMVAETTANASYSYDDQPAWVNNLAGYDNDSETDGINMVVDYNSTFELPSDITAEWRNMYDDTSGVLINTVEKLDYTVEISQEDVVKETIAYTWNETTEVYDASAQQTVIDTSVFGSGFVANYKVTTPTGVETIKMMDIVVGVFPPTFDGIADRYINEMTAVDLMEGITADDGYGNDITNTVMISAPAGLNMYSPLPGTYTIDLEFTHKVHFDGIPAVLTIEGTVYEHGALNSAAGYNSNILDIYTDVTNFKTVSTDYAVMYYVVDGNGEVSGIYDRFNWNYTTADGVSTEYDNKPELFHSELVLEDGGFVMIVGRGHADKSALRSSLLVGDSMTFVTPTEDQDFDIVVNDSYTLTVDDKTAPQAVVIDENYSFVVGEYETVDAAILANVVGFDFNDAPKDLTSYVSDNGGLLVDTPATYTVEVTIEDVTGNAVVVEFDVTVVAATDVQGMIDASITISADEVQALLDAQTLTDAEIAKLIADATAIEETGCSSSIGFGSALVAVLAVVGTVGFVFVRKH